MKRLITLAALLSSLGLFALEILIEGSHARFSGSPPVAGIARDDGIRRLTAVEKGTIEAADWKIESVDRRSAWVGTAIERADAVTLGKGGDWNPPPGVYRVSAVRSGGAAGHTTLELYLIGLSLMVGEFDLLAIPVADDRVAFITADCAMPEMRAQLTPALPGEVDYELTIRFRANNRDEVTTYSGRVKADTAWHITGAMGSDFRGGYAALTCRYRGLEGRAAFAIRGLNPAKEDAGRFIGSISPLWYAHYVAIHESGSAAAPVMKQFIESEHARRGEIGVIYTPNASRDGGFGIYQLTNPKPTEQQLWSWKANCAEGARQLEAAQTYADRWMEKQRRQMLDEGFSVPVPPVSYGAVTFAEGTGRRIEHAVALKRYNGASSGNFCVWDNMTKQWKFNPKNNIGINYVERVSSEVKQ
ncbi:MAG: hypothetical protein AB7F32_06565 [Victivallaceae bacterium]